MFADDIALVAEVVKRYGAPAPFVEVGGLEDPCVADYQRTIDAMAALRVPSPGEASYAPRDQEIATAQQARYLSIHRPLERSCPGYICEDPSTGGLPIEKLSDKYRELGTVIALSTLEHVANPWAAVGSLREILRDGGVCIVSVPFMFPYHPSPEDHWRFTPSGLRLLFGSPGWEILEYGWRLRIPASAGVLDTKTGHPQAIESCYICARAV